MDDFFLLRGRAVRSQEAATFYAHPSAARVAAQKYCREHDGCDAEIVDTRMERAA